MKQPLHNFIGLKTALFFLCILAAQFSFAQKTPKVLPHIDSVNKKPDTLIQPLKGYTVTKDTSSKKRSPKIAATRSALIPGWGQIYNGKYWKLPIVYGAIRSNCRNIYYQYKNL